MYALLYKKQSEVKVSFDSIRKMPSSLEIYFEKLENCKTERKFQTVEQTKVILSYSGINGPKIRKKDAFFFF